MSKTGNLVGNRKAPILLLEWGSHIGTTKSAVWRRMKGGRSRLSHVEEPNHAPKPIAETIRKILHIRNNFLKSLTHSWNWGEGRNGHKPGSFNFSLGTLMAEHLRFLHEKVTENPHH